MRGRFNKRVTKLMVISSFLMTMGAVSITARIGFAQQDGQSWTPKSGTINSNAEGGTTKTVVEENGKGSTRTTTTTTNGAGVVVGSSQSIDNGDGTGESTSTETAGGVTKTTTEKHTKDRVEKQTVESAGGVTQKVTRETSVKGVNGWSILISETIYQHGTPFKRITYSSFPDGKFYHSEVLLSQQVDGQRSLAGARVVLTGEVVDGAPATLAVVDMEGSTLSDVVVQVGHRQVTTDLNGQAVINVDESTTERRNGKTVLTADVVGADLSAAATALVLHHSAENDKQLSIQGAPAVLTAGSDLPIRGIGIDPIAENNILMIDGSPMPLLAASPVELKAVTSTALPPGEHNIQLISGSGTAETRTNVARVDLLATQTTIQTGSGAMVNAAVSGLKGVPQSAYPLQLVLTNHNPKQIAFAGGAPQVTRTINFEDVNSSGQSSFAMPIRAMSPGQFRVTAVLSPFNPGSPIADAPPDCVNPLSQAGQMLEEANKKRLEAASLDTEANVLLDPAAAAADVKRLRGVAADQNRRAAILKKIKNHEQEAARLERDAAQNEAKAKEIEGLLDRYKDMKGQDHRKLGENKRHQARDLRAEADDLETEAHKAEDEAKTKCKH